MSIWSDFQPGDVISAYHKGIHIVTHVEPPNGKPFNDGIVHYQSVLDTNGKKTGRRKNSCHPGYCSVIDEAKVNAIYNEEIKTAEIKKTMMLSVLKENHASK